MTTEIADTGDFDEEYDDIVFESDIVTNEIYEALEKWDEDKEFVFAAIKDIRRRYHESSVLEAANELACESKGSKELDLALHIYATSRSRGTEDSIIYAIILAADFDAPEKASKILHTALKKIKDEDERLDEIVKLCNHHVPAMVELAQKELILLANRGNIDAQHRLGHSYFFGQCGFEKDWPKAYKWWKLAADNGNKYSMLDLALMYEHAEGTRRNRNKAFYYTKMAADRGNLEALTNLGYCYYWGIGTEVDYTLAVDCFKRVLEQKDCEISSHNLAERYRNGEGIETDYEQALYLHKKAARKKYPDSICCLGIMNIKGQGTPVNYVAGVRLLRRSAKLGSTRGMEELGKCYEYGTGVQQNWKKAMELYEQAAAERDYKDDEPIQCINRLRRKMQKKQ